MIKKQYDLKASMYNEKSTTNVTLDTIPNSPMLMLLQCVQYVEFRGYGNVVERDTRETLTYMTQEQADEFLKNFKEVYEYTFKD